MKWASMTIGSLFLAVQGASSPRIGPTESRPRHGKGILKRVRHRNVCADSCISHNYIRVLSRCNPGCSAGLFRWRSHVNEGTHWPRRATRTLQTLHDRCQMLSRLNRVYHARIAGCTQPQRWELTGHTLAWQHAWLYGASAIAQSRPLAPSIADKQDIPT